jgi:hypothetical protein
LGNIYYNDSDVTNFLNALPSGNYDWSSLTAIPNSAAQASLNGSTISNGFGYMTTNGTNTIVAGGVTNPQGLINAAVYGNYNLLQLAYVFIVKRSTGQIVYSTGDLQGAMSHQIGFGSKGVSQSVAGNQDLEIRIIAYT